MEENWIIGEFSQTDVKKINNLCFNLHLQKGQFQRSLVRYLMAAITSNNEDVTKAALNLVAIGLRDGALSSQDFLLILPVQLFKQLFMHQNKDIAFQASVAYELFFKLTRGNMHDMMNEILAYIRGILRQNHLGKDKVMNATNLMQSIIHAQERQRSYYLKWHRRSYHRNDSLCAECEYHEDELLYKDKWINQVNIRSSRKGLRPKSVTPTGNAFDEETKYESELQSGNRESNYFMEKQLTNNYCEKCKERKDTNKLTNEGRRSFPLLKDNSSECRECPSTAEDSNRSSKFNHRAIEINKITNKSIMKNCFSQTMNNSSYVLNSSSKLTNEAKALRSTKMFSSNSHWLENSNDDIQMIKVNHDSLVKSAPISYVPPDVVDGEETKTASSIPIKSGENYKKVLTKSASVQFDSPSPIMNKKISRQSLDRMNTLPRQVAHIDAKEPLYDSSYSSPISMQDSRMDHYLDVPRAPREIMINQLVSAVSIDTNDLSNYDKPKINEFKSHNLWGPQNFNESTLSNNEIISKLNSKKVFTLDKEIQNNIITHTKKINKKTQFVLEESLALKTSEMQTCNEQRNMSSQYDLKSAVESVHIQTHINTHSIEGKISIYNPKIETTSSVHTPLKHDKSTWENRPVKEHVDNQTQKFLSQEWVRYQKSKIIKSDFAVQISPLMYEVMLQVNNDRERSATESGIDNSFDNSSVVETDFTCVNGQNSPSKQKVFIDQEVSVFIPKVNKKFMCNRKPVCYDVGCYFNENNEMISNPRRSIGRRPIIDASRLGKSLEHIVQLPRKNKSVNVNIDVEHKGTECFLLK